MAEIVNKNAFTVSDGLLTFLNVDTVGLHAQLTNADLSLTQSATTPAIANAGTIATAGVVIARVTPASGVTGIILAAGTQPGQLVVVENDGAAGSSLTFDVVGTSNVVGGVGVIVPGGTSLLFSWNSVTSRWIPVSLPLSNGTLNLVQSSTTPDPGAAGTITTSGVGVARVTPAAARAGVILAAGNYPGQLVFVQNEGSLANSITFDVAGTSHVSDGINDIVWGGQTALFEWNSAQSLWFRHGGLLSGGNLPTLASATSPDPGAAGTIATAGVGRARVTPAAARTGIILAAGTIDGQEVIVVNEGAAANTLTFNTTPATSFVAGAATESAIAGLTSRRFVWTDGAWYSNRD